MTAAATRFVSEIARVWRLVAARWAVYLLMVAGLALAYCAVVIIGLYVRDELTYDQSIPGADQVYLVAPKYGPPGRPLIDSDRSPAGLGRWIRTDLPEAAAVARLDTQEWRVTSVRRSVKERFYWADPNIFAVLKLGVLRGDAATALNAPDSLVMTRRMAIAYFGRDDVVGRTLLVNGLHTFRVTAVLKDLPPNIHLDREIFASGTNPYGKLWAYDHDWGLLWPNAYTYVAFRPGTDVAAIPAKLQAISQAHWQGPNNLPDGFALILLSRLHFQPHGDGELKPRGHLDFVVALTGVAAAILALAGINFSGLILAERNERTAEMALHSALGARRIDLVGLVLREALIVNAVSAWLGLVAAEHLLPSLNAKLDLQLSLWRDPAGVFAATVLAVAVMALAGGLVPALIVSATGRARKTARRTDAVASMRWRGWVIAQLTLVIVLLIASHTMSRQWHFATKDALGFDAGNVVMVRLNDVAEVSVAFDRDIRSVPGVEAAAASWGAPTNDFVRPAWVTVPGRPLIALTRNSVHPDFFKVYGIRLLAGRNLHGTFVVPETPPEILVNLAAVRALGFGSPQAAIGQTLDYGTDRTRMRSVIVGVVPDVRVSTVYQPIQPMIFDNFAKYFTQINIRVAPGRTAATLARIDALWNRDAAGTVPVERRFFDDYLLQQYRYLHQQMLAFYIVSGVAITLSVLGLTGLSIFLARNQLREMAIRKALGATFRDLFVERMTPFIAPLLLTNLLAWPIAWLCLQAWLGSFADHIAPSLSSFVGAGLLAVGFSWATIAVHAATTAHDISVSSSLRHG